MNNRQLSINNYQLPKGYKQTEVGVIPEDWEVTSLQEACREPITYGIVQCGPHIKNGVPYIRVSDMDESELDVAQMLRTSPSIAAKFSRSTVQEGDLVYALRGKLGEVRLVDEKVAGSNLTQGTARLSPNSQIENRYLLWVMRSSQSLRQAEVESKGTTFREITLADLRDIKVPIPLPEEQRAIAQALSDVDALIAALDKFIAKQRHLKTATMQQLLTGKKRLPGFGGEWAERQIGPEIDLLTGYPFPSAQYFDSGIKLLRGSNIKRGITDWSDDLVQYWPEVTSDISQYVLHEGDIVVAMDGSLVGRSFARLAKSDLPALLLQRVARIRSEKIDMGYLKEWVCSKFFTEHCDAVKTVTAIPHISPGDIRSFTIQVPPTQEEQRAIATVLSDMDAAISALETRRAKTQAIKQGMMQELLTGRTRLV